MLAMQLGCDIFVSNSNVGQIVVSEFIAHRLYCCSLSDV
jgi:hypothetical protein